jgi:hypothetical protein
MTEHAQQDKTSVQTRQSESQGKPESDPAAQRQIAQQWADFVDAELDAARKRAVGAG